MTDRNMGLEAASHLSDADRATADRAWAAMNDSPMQQRLRERKAWYLSAVYFQPGDYDPDMLRRELERMRELGLTAVRFHNADPEEVGPGEFDFTRADAWMAAAEAAGIDVIYVPDLTRPSEAYLRSRGVEPDAFAVDALDGEAMREVLAGWIGPIGSRYADHPSLILWELLGEPDAGDADLSSEADRRRFGRWLAERYGDIAALDAAWNLYPHAGRRIVDSFDQAWRLVAGFSVEAKISGAHRARVNYGAARDLLRYQADKMLSRTRAAVACLREADANHPIAIGSHQLMVNQPSLRWDTFGWGRLADQHFSSIHLSWHFEPVAGEVDRPVYLQARLTRDAFKGGWTSAYETTGGPVQYSGGYPNAMTPGLMRRLVLSYLAAGNVCAAFWTWNHRPGGWEAGEYGLTSLSGRLTPWAKELGPISEGLRRYVHELWDAQADAPVGVLYDWDTEAILTLEPERHDLAGVGAFGGGTRQQHQRALIGAGRAMVNAHVPFEYVATAELAEGIAARYPVLYAPHLRALSGEVIERLANYVRAGGRLVADVQLAFLDPWGKMHPRGEGSAIEGLMGGWVDAIHDTRTARRRVGDLELEGFFGDLVVTDARVLARFDDGAPAACEHRLGKGSAVLLAWDAARMCHAPGQPAAERLLVELTTGLHRPRWSCSAPLAFRLRCASADHWLLINDGPARPALLRSHDRTYTAGQDVLTGEQIEVDGTLSVALPAESALWLRMT